VFFVHVGYWEKEERYTMDEYSYLKDSRKAMLLYKAGTGSATLYCRTTI